MSAADNGNVTSFPPLLGHSLHTLILGTMPGVQSLRQQQYYAHPRNALWPVLCAIVTGDTPCYSMHHQLTYTQRCQLIISAGFGLWDVLSSCERTGSLDSNIIRSTEVPNKIHALIGEHPELVTIACNGRAAHTLFKRHTQPLLVGPLPRIICLPSTSPAMASLSLQDKYQRWSEQIGYPPPVSAPDVR